MPDIIQPSFAKGELSPELFGRVDVSAYAIGLAKASNAIVHTYGGVSRRPGTKFIGPCKNHDAAVRLIPFQFKTTDQYVLEFGDEYMRVIRNGAYVTEGSKNITDITEADPGVVTAASHGFSDGDVVFISGVGGMLEVNNGFYKVASSTTHTFELTHVVSDADIDTSGFASYTSGGTVARVFEITTPYDVTDVFEIKYSQSADVMTLTHKDYPPKELTRTGHTSWTLSDLDIGSSVAIPTNIGGTVHTAGSETERYVVTQIDLETGEESLPGLSSSSVNISTITTGTTTTVTTSTNHGFSSGDEIFLDDIGGDLETVLKGNRYYITVSSNTVFTIQDVDGNDIDTSGLTGGSVGGKSIPCYHKFTSAATSPDNTITWNGVQGARRYAIYRREGVYGLIGESESTSFHDDNIIADTSEVPPVGRNPFRTDDDYPGAVGFYEQRRVFGGSVDNPDTSEFSQPGRISNFDRAQPSRDSDAITATLTSAQVNEIRHFVTLRELLVMTSGSEWSIGAGSDNFFGPSTIRQERASNWGSSHVRPITIGNTVLYVTDDEKIVRSLGYSFQSDNFQSTNLTVFSPHLIRAYTLTDWAMARNPENRVYIIRSDGECLTLAFDQEQEVVAWTTMSTAGDFESVATLRKEGDDGEDVVYFCVRRTINGNTVRYIESMSQRDWDEVEDCYYVDAGASYDSPITITNVELSNPGDIVEITTSAAHGLSNGDIVDIEDIEWTSTIDSLGNEVQPDYEINGHRFTVSAATSTTFQLEGTTSQIPDPSTYSSGGVVRLAVNKIYGLQHLAGLTTLAVLADGNVISVAGKGVNADGTVTFDRRFSRIHVGLPYTTDIQTLPLDTGQRESIQGYKKNVFRMMLKLYKTRGIFVGPNTDNLVELKERENEAFGEPTALTTGSKEVKMYPHWNHTGQIFFRQYYPLPFTLLAIVPRFEAGEE